LALVGACCRFGGDIAAQAAPLATLAPLRIMLLRRVGAHTRLRGSKRRQRQIFFWFDAEVFWHDCAMAHQHFEKG
jgi:hypothetical protein